MRPPPRLPAKAVAPRPPSPFRSKAIARRPLRFCLKLRQPNRRHLLRRPLNAARSLPLDGSLRALFGACGNEFAPRDGQVVAADFGCGAHSEALVETVPLEPLAAPRYDDAALDLESSAESAEDDAESLGHS